MLWNCLYFVRSKNIGLGNGQRKSSEFEEYILEKRKYLRDTLKLCERATQRVLLYSNNFLHKKLKTDPSVSDCKTYMYITVHAYGSHSLACWAFCDVLQISDYQVFQNSIVWFMMSCLVQELSIGYPTAVHTLKHVHSIH